MPEFHREISYYVNGEPITAEVLNRPLRELQDNALFLEAVLGQLFPAITVKQYEFADVISKNGEIHNGFSCIVLDLDQDEKDELIKGLSGGIIYSDDIAYPIEHIDRVADEGVIKIWVRGQKEWKTGMTIGVGKIVNSEMVYIPRVLIPKDLINQGCPPVDIVVGGFLIDKYEASIEFEGAQPVSAFGKIPARVSFTKARKLAIKHLVGGKTTLMRPTHFGEIILISRALELQMRGNDNYGCFSGDDGNNLANYGLAIDKEYILGDKYKPTVCFTGTGPKWTHCGAGVGVWDFYGNVREWCDMIISNSVYTHIRRIRVLNHENNWIEARLEYPWEWNREGVINLLVDGEWIETEYEEIEQIGIDRYKIILTDNIEGEITGGYQIKKYCVMPQGTAGKLNAPITENINDKMLYVQKTSVLTNKATPFEVNDLMQFIGTRHNNQMVETVQVIAVNEDAGNYILTVNRGIGGEPVNAPEGTQVVVLSRQLNTSGDYKYQYGQIITFRDDLVSLMLPKTAQGSSGDEADFEIIPTGVQYCMRGTDYSDRGLRKEYYTAIKNEGATAGFRCVLDLRI